MIYDKALRLPLWSFSHQDDSEEAPKEIVCASSTSTMSDQVKTNRNSKICQIGSTSSMDTEADARQGSTTSHIDFGTIINLMSDDTYNVMSFIWICHYIWAIPVKVSALTRY